MLAWHAGMDGENAFGPMNVIRSTSGKSLEEVGLHAEFWDWDGDGDLDLLASDVTRGLLMYENVGTKTEPILADNGTPLVAEDAKFGVEEGEFAFGDAVYMSHAQPLMHDWDGDGLADLIIAGSLSRGGEAVAYCKNIGKVNSPQFAAPTILAQAQPRRLISKIHGKFHWFSDGYERSIGESWRVAIGDVNGDGLEDLVVGDAYDTSALKKSILDSHESVRVAWDELKEANRNFDKLFEQLEEFPEQEEIDRYRAAVEDAEASFRQVYCAAAGTDEDDFPVGTAYLWVFERLPSGPADATHAKSTSNSSSAQQDSNLELTASIEPAVVSRGDEAELVLSLTIPRGFHIYGSRDSTYPTTVEIPDIESITAEPADVPNGRRHRKSNGAVNYWLTGKKEVRQKIKISENASGEITLGGSLDFMICDEDTCQPPAKLPFEVTITVVNADEANGKQTPLEFENPVRLEANGSPIRVESPGYATPCLVDMDGDGHKDLLVGQYADGKINVYRNLGDGRYAEGQWLEAEGAVAEVPGIW